MYVHTAPDMREWGIGRRHREKKNIERNQRKIKPSHEQNLKRGLHTGVKCDNLFMDTAQAWHGSTMVLSGLILPRIPLCRNNLKHKFAHGFAKRIMRLTEKCCIFPRYACCLQSMIHWVSISVPRTPIPKSNCLFLHMHACIHLPH